MMLELLLILSLITCIIFIIYILRRNNSNLNVSDLERAEKAVDNFIDLKVSISKLSKPNKDLNHIK